MGKNIFHASAAGTSQGAKICNNILLGILLIGTSEALALGVANGYEGGFGVDLMLKDLGLAAEAALWTQASIPLGELARNLYTVHSTAGNGKLDFSSILNLLKQPSV